MMASLLKDLAEIGIAVGNNDVKVMQLLTITCNFLWLTVVLCVCIIVRVKMHVFSGVCEGRGSILGILQHPFTLGFSFPLYLTLFFEISLPMRPGISYRDPYLPSSQVLGIQLCAHYTWLFFVLNFGVFNVG